MAISLQVGSSSFIFMVQEPGDEKTPPGAPDSQIVAHTTLQKRIDESLYLQADKVREAWIENNPAAADLSALLRVCAAVQEARDVEAVATPPVIAGLLSCLPAHRGCVLLLREDSEEPRVVAARTRGSQSHEPFPVSRSVLTRTLSERAALLCTDIEAAAALSAAESLSAASVRSLMCAPLIGRQRLLGALYLDTPQPLALSERHLELVVAAAAITSLAVENASYIEWLRGENRRLQAQGAASDMVGESPVMKRLYTLLQRVAPTDATVLIRGESGTGKELCARAIHTLARARRAPSWPSTAPPCPRRCWRASCSATRRARSPAPCSRKLGRFELADGGTLFLDEIGEMPLALQAKLLRVLQEREFERVGGARPDPGRRAHHRRHQPRPREAMSSRAASARTSTTA